MPAVLEKSRSVDSGHGASGRHSLVSSSVTPSKLSISPRSSGMSESSDEGDWGFFAPLHDTDHRSSTSLASVQENPDEEASERPARRVPPLPAAAASATLKVGRLQQQQQPNGHDQLGGPKLLSSPPPRLHSSNEALPDVRGSRTQSESGVGRSSPKKRVFRTFNMGIVQRWKQLATRARSLEDPWIKYRLDELPIEECTRYRYSSIRKQWTKDNVKLKIQTEPFARGAMRECYRVKKLSSFMNDDNWDNAQNYVAKRYMNEVDRNTVFEDVKLQMDAKLWASEYNRHKPPKKIDIAQMCVLEFVNRPGQPLYHLEHFFEGEYIKYNSNSGFVCETARTTPHAFSHFTFERSGHQLIVVDVQGVGDLYTDPQIHTADSKGYGDGNLGTKGMALFFHSHACNDICRSLGLTEFDLSVTERASMREYIRTQRHNSHTVFRGSEEVCVSLPSLPEGTGNATESLRLRTLSNSNYDMDIGNELLGGGAPHRLTPVSSSHHLADQRQEDEGEDRQFNLDSDSDSSSSEDDDDEDDRTYASKNIPKSRGTDSNNNNQPNTNNSLSSSTDGSVEVDVDAVEAETGSLQVVVQLGGRKSTCQLLHETSAAMMSADPVETTPVTVDSKLTDPRHLTELVDRVLERHETVVRERMFARMPGRSWNESVVIELAGSQELAVVTAAAAVEASVVDESTITKARSEMGGGGSMEDIGVFLGDPPSPLMSPPRARRGGVRFSDDSECNSEPERSSADSTCLVARPRPRQRSHNSDTESAVSVIEEEEKEAYWEEVRKRSRPACLMEMDLDKLRSIHAEAQQQQQQQRASESSATGHGRPSLLGQIHLDLARYHELCRFVKEEGSIEYDKAAAWFHLDLAAKCNVLEAVITVAQIHLGLPHELLKDFHVDDEGDEDEVDTGLDWMQTAAELGDRMAMLYMAEAFEQGGKRLGADRQQSYREAVGWYERSLEALKMSWKGGQQDDEDSGCDASEYDSTTETHPKHVILARLAHLYREGGHGLEVDASHAGDLYNEAAEAAMEHMAGKLANKYYMLAEECYAEVPDDDEEEGGEGETSA